MKGLRTRVILHNYRRGLFRQSPLERLRRFLRRHSFGIL